MLGEPSPEELDNKLRWLLSSGEPVSLAPGIFKLLFARCIAAAKTAW